MKTLLKVLLPILVLAAGIGTTLLLMKYRKQVEAEPVRALPPLVRTVEAATTNHRFRVITQGTVRPRTEIQLVSEIAGKVIEVAPSFDAGGFFKKGDVLVRIEQADYEAAVTQAASRVAEARYRLEFEQAEADVARREWENLGAGGEPTALLLREPQLAQARAALASAEAALDQAKRDLRRTELRAPFDGRVGETSVDAGQYVARGTSVGRLYAVDFAEVRLPLAADDLAYVTVPMDYRGEPAEMRGPEVWLHGDWAGRTHTWTGYVDRTEGEVDVRTRMLSVVAQVPNPYGRRGGEERPPLAVGMFVEAEIMGMVASNVVVLPRSALRGKGRVLVVGEGSRLRYREVDVLRADREAAVIGGGLAAGELVCVSPLDVVTDGMEVRLFQETPEGQDEQEERAGGGLATGKKEGE